MESTQQIQSIRPVFNLLRFTFGIVPIVAGLDKFTDLLTHWEQYLSPALTGMLPLSAHTFMMVVGIIEIIAGILVLVKPAIGGLVVAAWLTLIGLTLIFSLQFLDVAVRDIVMATGAFSLARISKIAS